MFLRYLSHEMRTPMNIMMAGLTCLDKELVKMHGSEEAKEIASELRLSCQESIDILSDMLTVEKAGSGLLELFPSDIHVKIFVEGCVSAFDLQVENRCLLHS